MYIYTYIHYRELLLLCTCLRFTLNVSQRLTRFRFYYSTLSVVLVFWSFVWLYVSSRSLLLGLSFSFLFVFLSVHTLYTLSTNAAGNRTLCDLCQAKYQRKQSRHKERRIIEHEAAEELDGTHVKTDKENNWVADPISFFFTVLPI